jgi:hypothetical protein
VPPPGGSVSIPPPEGSVSIPPPEGSQSVPPPGGSEGPTASAPGGSTSVAPSFSGGVGGITGQPPGPEATLPPTDELAARQPTGDTWRILLVAMAGLLAAILLLTPTRRVEPVRDQRR